MVRIIPFALSLFLVTNLAEARQPYLAQLSQAFPHSRIDTGSKCMTCHDGRRMNAFGQDFVELVLRSPTRPFDFSPLRDLDSDGDGISNFDEMMAGTNPGRREAPVELMPDESSSREEIVFVHD